jgi:Domain of unknown function (DUF5916)/Carbohydrate family 9 binding domain-like
MLCSAMGLVFCGPAAAQESAAVHNLSGRGKVLQMVRTDTPPVIDGVMDEIWSIAPVIDDLHQVEPIEYSTPTEKTVIRVLYDEDFLYVSGMMYYSDASNIVGNKLIQGANMSTEDKLRLYINPFDDGRNGYIFQTNPNGIRTEAILENVTGFNYDWSGIWIAASKRTNYGWFGEMAIPYKTLSFDPHSDSWGISFLRSVMSKAEIMAWTSFNRKTDPSNFGTAAGLTDLQQGRGLDVIPGISATNSREYEPNSSGTEVDPTLDVFYKFTPNLTGALTFNSDFSATDVDSRQVQLTRFNLFFPEQRKFFLQEADIFEFGGLSTNGKPFFSRSIGIGPGGQQLDLDAGGKLTGRIGRWNIGALAVRQAGNVGNVADGGLPIDDSDLLVGRVAVNVLEQSTIGVIATSGNPVSDASNSLIGADFNYLNTRSFEKISIEGQLWYQRSETQGLDGEDSAWGVRLFTPNDEGFRGKIQFSEFGDNFFPALGFVNRTGIKQSEAGLGHVKRFAADSWLRSFENVLVAKRTTDTGGNVESQELRLDLSRIENQVGDSAQLLYLDRREVLTEPFTIADGVTIPVGDYSFERYGVTFATGGQRKVVLELRLENGGFFSGDRKTVKMKLDWQPSKYFTGVFEYEYNGVDLPEGKFDVRLMRVRTDVAFNAEWAWITTAQYDNQSELLDANSRLQWIPVAGREFYIIYNGGWLDENRMGFEQIGQSATLKLSHTFRF